MDDHQKQVFHEFVERDIIQVIVGATILAIPVGFTEETWVLGVQLPLANALLILAMSLAFVSIFTYYHYFHTGLHHVNFYKRVLSTYLIAFLIVGLLLTVIQKAPWFTDTLLAFKRTVIVALPACMSAAITDTLK